MSEMTFLLPDLGEGLTEAEIVRWLVAEGDVVEIDQPIAEVETAKAVVEVPTPHGGVVTRLHTSEGTVLDVGSPLISVKEPGERGFTEPGVVTPVDEGSGNVLVGYGTAAAPRRRSRRRPATPPGSSSSRRPGAHTPEQPERRPGPADSAVRRPGALTSEQPARPSAAPSEQPGPSGLTERQPVVSPVVRRLARDNGVDLGSLRGSGPVGLITRRDVEAAISAAAAPQVPEPADGPPAEVTGERIPLRGLRRAVADRLARSRREIPEATVWVDVDATALLETRLELGDVSLLALLARFCLLGLRRHPLLNARIDDERAEIVLNPAVNLGFAAQTPRGLVVPVVRDAHTMSARSLTTEIQRLATAAREGGIAPGDLTGGTFTLNNYGRYGVDGSAAIINHPEVAILGIGRIIDRPWVVDGTLAVRKVAQLTLAFDHRVCDGEDAGGFLRFVADCVENPINSLGDM